MKRLLVVTALGAASCGGGKRGQSFHDGMQVVCSSTGTVENADAKAVARAYADARPDQRRAILVDALARAKLADCALLDPPRPPRPDAGPPPPPDAAPPAPDAGVPIAPVG